MKKLHFQTRLSVYVFWLKMSRGEKKETTQMNLKEFSRKKALGNCGNTVCAAIISLKEPLRNSQHCGPEGVLFNSVESRLAQG